MLSAWWLNIVILQPPAEVSSQGAANDNDPRRHAVLPPVKDVPYEDGGCQCGQEAGPNVQVARPGQVGVGPYTVESYQSNDQNKTGKLEHSSYGFLPPLDILWNNR